MKRAVLLVSLVAVMTAVAAGVAWAAAMEEFCEVSKDVVALLNRAASG